MDADEGSKSRGVEEGMSVFALGGRLLFVCALGEDVLRCAVHRCREKVDVLSWAGHRQRWKVDSLSWARQV